jgi:hypothetical protein
LLYDYYAFGYLPVTDDTIYKNIRLVRPGSWIKVSRKFSIETGPRELLAIPEGEIKKSLLLEYFYESIGRKLKNIPPDGAIFCLTSGHDTLMGILGMKVNGYRTDTATWGLSHSDDIAGARRRHSLFSGNTGHIEILIDGVELAPGDFEANADLLGGIGTAASIYLNYFTEKMVSSGKIHHLYCDHYEATRRQLMSLEEIREKYTTPPPVVRKYFLDHEHYKNRVDLIINSIPAHYHHDHLMEFYFYDRYIRGPFYKNPVVSHMGAIKYTLPLDYRFLNFNHAVISQCHESTGGDIFRAMAGRLGMDVSNITARLPDGAKQLPADTPSIIRNNKEYFISILESPYSRELSGLWDLARMKDTILRDTLIEKEEWFVLRLLHLLIFKDKYRIGVR